MAAVRHLRFFKSRNFKCLSGSEGQYASSCQYQMLCRSVKPLPPFWICKILQSQLSRRSNCFIVQNVVEITQTVAEVCRFFDISKMAAVRHLGFVMRLLRLRQRRAFGGLYHCATFGWNRCSNFDNMHVFRFQGFGLKTPIHIRVLTSQMGSHVNISQKAHPCGSPRRLSHHA